MKGDIGMANYEKQVEQEAAYPIPISLYRDRGDRTFILSDAEVNLMRLEFLLS